LALPRGAAQHAGDSGCGLVLHHGTRHTAHGTWHMADTYVQGRKHSQGDMEPGRNVVFNSVNTVSPA